MPEKVRCFIAIDLDRPIRQLITEIQEKLASLDPFVKWVAPEHAHITLKFLGDIPLEQIPKIEESLKKAAQMHEKTFFTTTRLNVFPHLKSPRIIFLDIEKNDQLSRLQQSLEQALIHLDLKKDQKEFLAHITLARVRSDDGRKQISESLEKITGLTPIRQELKSIKLYKSTLMPQGPVYECLFESFLKEPAHG